MSNTINITTGYNNVNLYQKGNGTIIAYQDAVKENIMTTDDIKKSPFILSVYLDDTATNAANGHVFIENGTEFNGET